MKWNTTTKDTRGVRRGVVVDGVGLFLATRPERQKRARINNALGDVAVRREATKHLLSFIGHCRASLLFFSHTKTLLFCFIPNLNRNGQCGEMLPNVQLWDPRRHHGEPLTWQWPSNHSQSQKIRQDVEWVFWNCVFLPVTSQGIAIGHSGVSSNAICRILHESDFLRRHYITWSIQYKLNEMNN